ncbi:kinase-like domain-containing protein [Amylostereum chailletii]|nr:kinase-like domain-containing protein [Amylostereum chailletii]
MFGIFFSGWKQAQACICPTAVSADIPGAATPEPISLQPPPSPTLLSPPCSGTKASVVAPPRSQTKALSVTPPTAESKMSLLTPSSPNPSACPSPTPSALFSAPSSICTAVTCPSPVPSSQSFFEPKPAPRLFSTADFKVLRVLGKGTYGQVFLVRDRRTRAKFALKVVDKSIFQKQKLGPKQVLLEQRAMRATTTARGFVQLHASWHDDAYYYFLLDVAKGDLFTMIYTDCRLPFSVVQFYAAQLLLSLESMRDRHIVHRDLKPENILFDKAGNALIADFGLCEQLADAYDVCASHPRGTPLYMSPEVINRTPASYDVDWWAYGVIVYEMAMARVPFRASEGVSLADAILSHELTFDECVHPDAKDFIEKILVKDRAARPTLVQMKAHVFFRGINWDALASGSVSPPTSPQSPPKSLIRPNVKIPTGTSYSADEDPVPAFTFTSPQIDVKPIPPVVVSKGTLRDALVPRTCEARTKFMKFFGMHKADKSLRTAQAPTTDKAISGPRHSSSFMGPSSYTSSPYVPVQGSAYPPAQAPSTRKYRTSSSFMNDDERGDLGMWSTLKSLRGVQEVRRVQHRFELD